MIRFKFLPMPKREPTVQKWDPVKEEFYLDVSDPQTERYLDDVYERIHPGVLRWRRRGGIVAKAAQATSLVAAMTSGAAAHEVVARRKLSCLGDGTPQNPQCTALKVTGAGKFCAACGCGTWPVANLDGGILPKLSWAKLDCPLKRPGFSNS